MSRPSADPWPRACLVLAVAHAVFLGISSARVGLVAVVLWQVVRPALAVAATTLLAIALVRAWRRREGPTGRQLAGLAALALVIGPLAVLRTYPSSYDRQPSEVPFRLPLDGRVTVAWGGATLSANYHAVMADQRWAYDLLVTVSGRSHTGDGSRLADYYAFGRPVLAPADGLVRVVRDGEPDGPIGQWRVFKALGNHVIVEVADGAFLFIAHFQQHSIVVAPGDRVGAGQPIGRIGNSGNSSEPHVHVHLQDTPTAYFGEGIPLYFHGYRARGEHVARGMPIGGRERRSRTFPGAFTGEVVEHVGGGARHAPPASSVARGSARRGGTTAGARADIAEGRDIRPAWAHVLLLPPAAAPGGARLSRAFFDERWPISARRAEPQAAAHGGRRSSSVSDAGRVAGERAGTPSNHSSNG